MTESQQIIENLKTAIKAAGDILGILEKAEQPAEHVWEHGDVFLFLPKTAPSVMFYVKPYGGKKAKVHYLSQDYVALGELKTYLSTSEFLFNIKEKLNG